MAWDSWAGWLFYNAVPAIGANWQPILIIVLALVLFIVFKDRILLAVAGDNKFHGDVLSGMKTILGLLCCSCGWKTWCSPCLGCCQCFDLLLSRFCGCNGTADCSLDSVLSFQNALQRCLGLNPRVVLISKVVAGDLPLEEDGDFFFSIDCGVSPEQRSSVEESDGHAIQFADSMLCKVRHSFFEHPVHIAIWRLHFLSPTKLCEVYLRPKVLFELAHRNEDSRKTWRIAMHSVDAAAGQRTHPWICFEVQELDSGLKDQYQSLTITEDAPVDTESGCGGVSPLWCGSPRVASLNLVARQSNYASFKLQRSELYDQDLKAMREPVNTGEHYRCLNHRWSKRVCHGAFLVLLLISLPRLYIMSCYHQYEWLAVAERQGDAVTKTREKVWTNPELWTLWQECVQDTIGLEDDTINKTSGFLHYCRPKEEEVEETCQLLAQNTSLQPAPRAFKEVLDLFQDSGGLGQAIVRQLRNLDQTLHNVDSSRTPQYLLTGGLPCPCNVVMVRNLKVFGQLRLHACLDLLILLLIIFILVMRCWFMPQRVLQSA
ncbi:unnamed protein product [Durusdinium trenchii]|uniref:Uncharacterized protein n=2 Tax=Durusdinium trenchii TaxID=1381693 RepID=A0ABP0QL11_9DINO